LLVSQEQTASKRIFSVVARVENLGVLRRFVRETAVAMGADPDTVASLVLATDEVATNVIVHGYRGRDGPIEVVVERQGDNVVVLVRDHAPPFDSTAYPAPDLTIPPEQRPLGGLGLFLARRVVDEMSHRLSTDGGNEVTLVKRIESDCH